MNDKHKYIYEGPVTVFGICVTNYWKGETMASSEIKAISNLKCQYKKQYHKTMNAKVELPGKIVMVE